MRYLSAYMLATLGGNSSPGVGDIEKILGSVGIDCDKERCQKLIDELSKRKLDEVIAAGEAKLETVPFGGGGGGAAVAVATDSGETKGAPVEEKKEAAKEESDSSDDDMGFGLFD